jgi:hypothetical protein
MERTLESLGPRRRPRDVGANHRSLDRWSRTSAVRGAMEIHPCRAEKMHEAVARGVQGRSRTALGRATQNQPGPSVYWDEKA